MPEMFADEIVLIHYICSTGDSIQVDSLLIPLKLIVK
jgi:hypothetical protein